jgi:hypothetical protein
MFVNELFNKKKITESLRDGEYYTYTVTFADGTTDTINVDSDEFDFGSHYAKKGKKVTNVARQGGIQGSERIAPRKPHQWPDDSMAKSQRAYDKQMPEGVAEGSFGSGYGSAFTLYVNTGEKPATKTKTKKFKREDDAVLWAEDYADQHEMFPNLKMEIQDENGNVVWELEESQDVAEGFFGIDDKIKGKIQNIVSDLSDIPGMWDHKAQTFTDAGMDKLKTVLKNNPKYIKYALNLDYRDYEAEGVAEGSSSDLEQLIQQYEDMVENVYGMVPGPRQRQAIADRDALEARIEALPGGKSALEKWARAYNDSFDEGVAEQAPPINVPQGWQAKTQPNGSTQISKIGSMSSADYKQNMADYKAKNWTPEKMADFTQRMASGQGYTDTERAANYQQQQQHFGKYADQPLQDVDEDSAREKLHQRHQELRKKSGLPDPDYYKELRASYDIENDQERQARQAEIKKKYKVAEGKKDSDELAKYENDVKTLLANGDMKTAKKVAGLSPDAAHRNRLRNIIRRYDSKQGVAEAGPFSYGAKKPRKGSVADLAARKRQEQEQDRKPIEPQDQRVGTAKVVTNEDIEKYLEEMRRAGYDVVTESATLCPECGGPAYSNQMLAEKQDACYSKVKSRYKVWPSAYASGALVRCRKVGAKNWGNKSKK